MRSRLLDLLKDQLKDKFNILCVVMIAAMYMVVTVITAQFSFLDVQLRVTEALCILPVFTPVAIPALFIGCITSVHNFLHRKGPRGRQPPSYIISEAGLKPDCEGRWRYSIAGPRRLGPCAAAAREAARKGTGGTDDVRREGQPRKA